MVVAGIVGYGVGYIVGFVLAWKVFAYMLRREDRLLHKLDERREQNGKA